MNNKPRYNSIVIKCIHLRLLNRVDFDNKVIRKDLLTMLGELYHIPKEERCKVVDEMKRCNIITDADKYNFTINNAIDA